METEARRFAKRIIKRLLARGFNPQSLYKVALMAHQYASYRQEILKGVPEALHLETIEELKQLIKGE